MRKLFLPLTVILFVAACAPRDVAKENKKGFQPTSSSDKTATYFVDGDGEVSETCKGKNWSVLEIPKSDEEGIFDGKIKAVLLAGNLNCFKIGSRVEVKYTRNDQEVLGFAKIKSTEGVANNKLNKNHAELFDMTISALKDRGKDLMDEAKNRPDGSFDAQGMVSVTTFELEGLQTDASSDAPEMEVKTIFSVEGERPTTCEESEKDWRYITAPLGMNMDGTIMAVLDRGDKNCLRIGSQVEVKYKAADGTTTKSGVMVKVVAVEIIASSTLSFAHAQIFATTLDQAKIYYAENLGHETVSVVYFAKDAAPSRVASTESDNLSL